MSFQTVMLKGVSVVNPASSGIRDGVTPAPPTGGEMDVSRGTNLPLNHKRERARPYG